ncbi:MAG TPA: anaerobic ribonucleoside-triphosphate reductase activating protein [Rickettsiales bacterium]|nr:anaerobic ribonucleoside-triphosphate reductase activating protein [Rickettsiales bacterium]
MLPITDITKFTFQDFPDKTACIIWLAGCNFRCPYCHNPDFIMKKCKCLDEKEVFDFLESRVELLDGVVLSGGECTLSNELYDFIKKIKSMGFLVKIDTNGTNFELVKRLIEDKLIDFIALDYKAPKNKFLSIAKIDKFDIFSETLNFAISSNIDMEIRTTVHTKLLNEDDLNEIINDLNSRNYKSNFYIQNFRNDSGSTLDNIGDQERVLDKNLILKKDFGVFFRNFF